MIYPIVILLRESGSYLTPIFAIFDHGACDCAYDLWNADPHTPVSKLFHLDP